MSSLTGSYENWSFPPLKMYWLVLYRWVVVGQRQAMTTRNNCSVLKGNVHLLCFITVYLSLNVIFWGFTPVQCVCRCCGLCWCVVLRQNGKLFKPIYSAAARNGSSGETMHRSYHCITFIVTKEHLWQKKKKICCFFLTRYQKHSLNKSHM